MKNVLILFFVSIATIGFSQTTTHCVDSTISTVDTADEVSITWPSTGTGFKTKFQWSMNLWFTRTSGTLADSVFLEKKAVGETSWHIIDTLIVGAANPVEWLMEGEELDGILRLRTKCPDNTTHVAHIKPCWSRWDSRL